MSSVRILLRLPASTPVATAYIRGYTLRTLRGHTIQIVKIRRVGNSNVISLPREFEQSGFTPGTLVLVEETAAGELTIILASRVKRDIRESIKRVVAENREALEMLAAYDRGERAAPDSGSGSNDADGS